MKKLLATLLAAIGLNTACSQGFKNADVDEFAQLIKSPSAVVLDVRTPAEYAEGHIDGALLIDWRSGDFLAKADSLLPRDKTIAIYCRSGRRSAEAAAQLAPKGYKLVNLKGGIIAWQAAGRPLTTK